MSNQSYENYLDETLLKEGDERLSAESFTRSNWLLSYSDLVTLLLVFFIIFFNAAEEKDESGKPQYSPVLVSVLSAFGGAAKIDASEKIGNGVTTNVTGAKGGVEDVSKGPITRDMTEAYQALSKIQTAEIQVEYPHFYVDFGAGGFFATGSYALTRTGKDYLRRVYRGLQPFRSSVYVTIQGHADPRPTSASPHRRYGSNLELSSLRALAAYLYLNELGMPKDSMSIAGFADHKSRSSLKGGEAIDPKSQAASLARDRRVSFRIEWK